MHVPTESPAEMTLSNLAPLSRSHLSNSPVSAAERKPWTAAWVDSFLAGLIRRPSCGMRRKIIRELTGEKWAWHVDRMALTGATSSPPLNTLRGESVAFPTNVGDSAGERKAEADLMRHVITSTRLGNVLCIVWAAIACTEAEAIR